MIGKLLKVENLEIYFEDKKTFKEKNKQPPVVNQVSFELDAGEILGIVGESGSGKTITSLSIAGLLPNGAKISQGSIVLGEKDLLKMSEKELRKLKGEEIAMIFQEPMTSLNPVLKVGYQVEEMLELHTSLPRDERKIRTLSMLEQVGLNNVELVYEKYPHQLSGGMRQRVMIAMAMICKPRLLIADEPTTALDATVQAQILALLKKLNSEFGTTIIIISHDLNVIKGISKKILVMKDGKIVEAGTTKQIFEHPQQEYTKKLVEAIPKINYRVKDGKVKNPSTTYDFSIENEIILEVKDLSVYYNEKKKDLLSTTYKKEEVHGVSMLLRSSQILGIVGESGSGKTTLAKAIVGLIKEVKGQIISSEPRPQMVFQDPYGSLNPKKTIGWILEEPLKVQGGYSKQSRKDKVKQMLKEVDLDENYIDRYPSELSGGQRQRVSIACALITNSKLIVLDEPVSALDITVSSQVLDLLLKLRTKYGLSYIFISHDLNVIYQICDYVLVMHQGIIVEEGGIKEIFTSPEHEYTKMLLGSALG